MFRLTPLVRNLIIINVVVFLAQNLLSNLYLTEYMSLWSIHSPNFKPYQFFTYMFAHGGFGHIFFNMLALASFAPILESYWGEKKFLIFYLATGIGAGVIYALVNFFLGTSAGGHYAWCLRSYLWNINGLWHGLSKPGTYVTFSTHSDKS